MCLSCGFYNGRQVLDLVAQKAARDARITAKHERIKLQNEQVTPSEAEEVTKVEPVAEEKK